MNAFYSPFEWILDESLKDRLLKRTKKTDGCWLWSGTLTKQGYGHIRWKKRTLLCHRVSYCFFIAPFNKNICCLHHCDNPSCVNPNHLFLGTNKENMNDRDRKGRHVAWHLRQKECKNGHPYVHGSFNFELNQSGRPRRRCLICRRLTDKKRRK